MKVEKSAPKEEQSANEAGEVATEVPQENTDEQNESDTSESEEDEDELILDRGVLTTEEVAALVDILKPTKEAYQMALHAQMIAEEDFNKDPMTATCACQHCVGQREQRDLAAKIVKMLEHTVNAYQKIKRMK